MVTSDVQEYVQLEANSVQGAPSCWKHACVACWSFLSAGFVMLICQVPQVGVSFPSFAREGHMQNGHSSAYNFDARLHETIVLHAKSPLKAAQRADVALKSQKTKPTRVDIAMLDRGLCDSREKAKRFVMAGQVRVNGQKALKANHMVKPGDEVTLAGIEKFVSRGGYKLEHALDNFSIEVAGLRAIDLGASTGGFTDCLLQRGAAAVAAVDVGQGQLAWKLRSDARVLVMERTNARYLEASSFPEPLKFFDIVVIDCSFISLRIILPVAANLLLSNGHVIALIKPQFEAGKEEVDKGKGVIRDPEVHQRVIDELRTFVADELPMLEWLAETASPLLGPAGNKEFLVLLRKV